MRTQNRRFMLNSDKFASGRRISLPWSILAPLAGFLIACLSPAAAQRSTPVQLIAPGGAASDNFGWSSAYSGDTIVIGSINHDGPGGADQGSANVYRWTGTGWAFEAVLLASDGAAGDRLGYSVAISGDTIAIGADYDDSGAEIDQGAVYIFTRTGTSWTQQAKIVAADGMSDDRFGTSVALQGNTLAVGAYGDDVSGRINQGSVYVYSRSGSAWTQQTKLTASDGEEEDFFGGTLAIDGDMLAVGCFYDTVAGMYHRGSVYVFARTSAVWTQQAQLIASDGASDDAFGHFVSVSGDTVAVGALGNNDVRGAAYIYTRVGATWSQQTKITAPDAQPIDGLGSSGSLDGDTLVVTARHADVGGVTDAGAGYIYVRSGGTWTLEAKLTAPDGAAVDNFGWTSAIVGDSVVIGARNDDVGANVNQGLAWVFSRVGSTWIGPDFKVVAADEAVGDFFATSVAISGDTAIVGARADDGNKGAAYIFTRSGAAWVQQSKLTASDGASGDLFGYSSAISGDTAIVGAFADDGNKGSAYVFTRSGTVWMQQAQLHATDGVGGDAFGIAVAIFGDTAIVGAYGDDGVKGAAYIFTRSGTAWVQQSKLTASDGVMSDAFGHFVAISGDTAIVGAHADDGGFADQGSAYVFARSGAAWLQQSKLTASDGAANDRFGLPVAISGDTAIVGAFGDDGQKGSAYVFIRSGTAWTQQSKLTASDGVASDNFGYSVAISGDTAIVGAYGDDGQRGSAYVFTRSGTVWTQQSKRTAPDGEVGDYFGVSAAISGDTAIVGAFLDDVGFVDQGSAYIFDIPSNTFSLAHNDSLDISYPSLAAAFLPAQSGQQITATSQAFAEVTSLDTFGRSLGIFSSGALRTPSTSVLSLSGYSSLAAPPGQPIEIFGQLRASGSISIFADRFLLGSRGIFTARTGSSVIIDAAWTNLEGQTRLEQSTSLTFSGHVDTIGPVTAAFNFSINASGMIHNNDTLSMTAGQLSSPFFHNCASTNIFGSTAIFGDFTNEAGAITTIRSGTLFVFGSLTNNGTIIGDLCATCSGTPPGFDVTGDLSMGNAASLLMLPGALVHVGGDFDCAINSNTRFDMAQATLQMEGTGQELTVEVMSLDIGADSSGQDRSFVGHYPVGVLWIGPFVSTVRLVDNHDNDGLGQGACEAIYAQLVRIEAGSRLINTHCRIYYSTLENYGIVETPENLIPIGAYCPADFNQDGGIDGTDVEAFFTAWEAGDFAADVNFDGGVDGGDVEVFFLAWEAGGC